MGSVGEKHKLYRISHCLLELHVLEHLREINISVLTVFSISIFKGYPFFRVRVKVRVRVLGNVFEKERNGNRKRKSQGVTTSC